MISADFLIGAVRASNDLHPVVKTELEEILRKEEWKQEEILKERKQEPQEKSLMARIAEGKAEEPKTISEQLTAICDEICDHYCKYPDVCMAERKDPDDAEDLLYRKYCGGCPLNRL